MRRPDRMPAIGMFHGREQAESLTATPGQDANGMKGSLEKLRHRRRDILLRPLPTLRVLLFDRLRERRRLDRAQIHQRVERGRHGTQGGLIFLQDALEIPASLPAFQVV